MEDFEYSVEISDRDWECFFTECEECDLLPPSLAGLDDSGMSDIDDTASILAKKAPGVDLIARFSATGRPIDGPPDCEGSPVEEYLSKHGFGGLESVLSGSEEDLHLQSVNIFFESLKDLTKAERPSKPSPVRAGTNTETPLGKEQEEMCVDGKLASGSSLPKSIPELNCPPARGETAVGKETTTPVDTVSHTNITRKAEAEFNISSESAASKSGQATLFYQEETFAETLENEIVRQSQLNKSLYKVNSMEKYTPLDDHSQDGLLRSQITLSRRFEAESLSNQELDSYIKWPEDQTTNIPLSTAIRKSKPTSLESSPSTSVRRKRRKKRRLSMEPMEGGNERQVVNKESDSEEERCQLRGGPSLFEQITPQKNHNSLFNPHSDTGNFPKNSPAEDIRLNKPPHSVLPCDSPCKYLAEETVELERCTAAVGSGENNRPVSNNANAGAHLLLGGRFNLENSAELYRYSGSPVIVSTCLTSRSSKDNLRQDLEVTMTTDSVYAGENKQNLDYHTTEVKPLSPLLTEESNVAAVDLGQSDGLSAAKSGMTGAPGNCGREERTLCRREAEHQHQRKINHHNKADKYRTLLEQKDNMCINHQQFKNKHHPFLNNISKTDIGTNVSSDGVCSSPDGLSFLHFDNDLCRQTEQPSEFETFSKPNFLPDQKTKMESTEIPTAHAMKKHSSKEETNQSLFEASLTSLSDITRVSSTWTLNTESIMSLSNENITDLSVSDCSSVNEPGSKIQEGNTLILGENKQKSEYVEQKDYTETQSEPKMCQNSVFTMSSFWNEMEKLTINDILGLRKNNNPPTNYHPPLHESEETDMLVASDSGLFTQNDESKTEPISKDKWKISDSSKNVMQDTEPVPLIQGVEIYPHNEMLTSVTDNPQTILPFGQQQSPRKICKNLSIRNLQTLKSDSFSLTERHGTGTLPRLDKEFEKGDIFREGCVLKNDDVASLTSSLTDSYSVSFTDVFQYLFGGKQSVPSQTPADDISFHYTGGNSVPETYDHFFSEFDTESFFYPFITAQDNEEDKTVPIFSCSRSPNRDMQFPEAYDYFFKSSSSDDSSVDSDEDDGFSPVRVVSRFSRKPSSAQITTDIYDNFFTDNDLRQNFFWKTTFSFRNIKFTASTIQKQRSNSVSLVHVRERDKALPRSPYHPNVLGHEDVTFPDPLLHHLEDRISSQLAQRPYTYDDLQATVSDPRLDAPLLPLRQSDMCLVCIAFASWVLKTANPQVGDTWKAVLLANVSALSAIRYLRKYVREKQAAREITPHHGALSDS